MSNEQAAILAVIDTFAGNLSSLRAAIREINEVEQLLKSVASPDAIGRRMQVAFPFGMQANLQGYAQHADDLAYAARMLRRRLRESRAELSEITPTVAETVADLIDPIEQAGLDATAFIQAGTNPAAIDLPAVDSMLVTLRRLRGRVTPLDRSRRPMKRKTTGKILKDKPLTPKQNEALAVLIECAGSKTEAAKRLGISRASLDERLTGVKLRGELSRQKSIKSGKLPTDRRGQSTI